MNKIIAVILSSVVIAGLFSGCRPEPEQEETILTPTEQLRQIEEIIGMEGILHYILAAYGKTGLINYIYDANEFLSRVENDIGFEGMLDYIAENWSDGNFKDYIAKQYNLIEPAPEAEPIPEPGEEPLPPEIPDGGTQIIITPYEAPPPPEAHAQETPAGTVYWVASGQVYHTAPDCSSLSRSRNIVSGTVAQSGKNRMCRLCEG
jgi:hypothetical protein